MRQCAMPAQADITTAPARGPFGRSPMDFRNSTQVTRMISRASAAALSRIAGPVAILSCLVLASCGGPVSENMPRANAVGDRLGGMFEPRQRDLPKPDPTQQALGEIPYCPEAQILDGTELFRDYVRGSEGDEQAITMQASVTETARECVYDPQVTQVTIKIGIAGRAILGPKGGPGTFQLPVRIAVLGSDDKPLFSEIERVAVTVNPGESSVPFDVVRDGITLPLPTPETVYGYRIYVGFDEIKKERRR